MFIDFQCLTVLNRTESYYVVLNRIESSGLLVFLGFFGVLLGYTGSDDQHLWVTCAWRRTDDHMPDAHLSK